MARIDTLTNFLTDVATAIKTKKGDDTPIQASQFDTEITNLSGGGGGNIEEYLQTTITDDNHEYFSSNIFKKFPKINVETTDLSYLFYMYKGTIYPELDTSEVTDFERFFYSNATTELPLYDTSNGVIMESFVSSCINITTFPLYNTSNATNLKSFCSNCVSLTEVPALDLSSAKDIDGMFANNTKLVTIPELNCKNVIKANVTVLQACSALVNFGGFKDIGMAYDTSRSANYGDYSLSVNNCSKLTEQSLINILNGLYDIASKGCKAQKCTLGSTNLAKLTSEAGQQALSNATAKGWTVS